MDRRTGRVLAFFLYSVLLFASAVVILLNPDGRLRLALACSLLVTSVSVRHLILYPSPPLHRQGGTNWRTKRRRWRRPTANSRR